MSNQENDIYIERIANELDSALLAIKQAIDEIREINDVEVTRCRMILEQAARNISGSLYE